MTTRTYWGWAVMGLGGVTRIIGMLVAERAPITRNFLELLQQFYLNLGEHIERAEKNVEDA